MKLQRIIGLFGAANQGKTTTLNYLIHLLSKAQMGLNYSTITIEDCGVEDNYDHTQSFEVNGLKIAVASSGDNGNAVANNIKFFKEQDCDIAVTATRTKGSSVIVLGEFAKEASINIEWVQKSNECNISHASKQLCNREIALYLLSLILK
jgi:GTPase SAR1 family protein